MLNPEMWWTQFHLFLLVLVRVASFWFVLPVMGQGVPVLTKIGIAATLALIIVPLVADYTLAENTLQLIFQILIEVLVGLVIGFGVILTFSAVYIAGQLIDIPMGFGMAGVFDPVSGMSVPLLTQYHRVLTVLVFFTISGHHTLIYNVTQSFTLIPLGKPTFEGSLLMVAMDGFADVFLLGFRIALPFIAAIFLTDVALGIASRAVPQINALILGFPIKIFIGFVIYFLYIPIFVGILAHTFDNRGLLTQLLQNFIGRLGGY